jgi:hypothetical protein
VFYTIKANNDDIVFHKQITIDLSIFPSLSGMLSGALFGAILGTAVRALIYPVVSVWSVFAALFTNLVLAFIIAVTFMRKKDVPVR